MSKPLKLLCIILSISMIGISAWYISANYTIQIQRKPGNDGGIACTTEAMLCPDGSTVGRVGPNCEFEVCPEIIPPAVEVSIPVNPNEEPPTDYTYESPLAQVPDEPLPEIHNAASFRVPEIIQYRSALNTREVSVLGVVVENNILIPTEYCPPNAMCKNSYPYPHIKIADSADPGRNKLYDLFVQMPTSYGKNEAAQYRIGSTVEIIGVVQGDKNGVQLNVGY